MKFQLVFLSAFCCYAAAINNNGNCPANLPKTSNLQEFRTSCYEFMLDQRYDWFHADGDCRMKGGFLVDIHDYAEQAFLFNACQELGFHGDAGLWIGLTDHDNYHGEGKWHWVSNKGIDFVNWAPGQPGMLAGSEDCVLMQFKENGQWHDHPCSTSFLVINNEHGWICEYPLSK